MASDTKILTDHDEIRRWAEARGGRPASAAETGQDADGDAGVLRIAFPDYGAEGLEEISWEQWFDKFEANDLALLCQEETAEGETSTFHKLVRRSES